MAVLDRLHAAVEVAVNKIASQAAELVTVKTALGAANADKAALQAKLDAANADQAGVDAEAARLEAAVAPVAPPAA